MKDVEIWEKAIVSVLNDEFIETMDKLEILEALYQELRFAKLRDEKKSTELISVTSEEG